MSSRSIERKLDALSLHFDKLADELYKTRQRLIQSERDLADAEARIAELEAPDLRLVPSGRPEDYEILEGDERY